MVLNIKEKKLIVSEVNEVAKNALSVVIADSRGIVANKMTELRKAGRELGVHIQIIRNTLLYRVTKGTNFECLKSFFVGPTLIAFSKKHPGAAARLFKSFSKENKNFKIKAAGFEGKIIPASQIDRLATLPTYEDAIIRLMSVMREASAGRLVRVFVAVRKQKEVA